MWVCEVGDVAEDDGGDDGGHAHAGDGQHDPRGVAAQEAAVPAMSRHVGRFVTLRLVSNSFGTKLMRLKVYHDFKG